jgi:hypothetical protein
MKTLITLRALLAGTPGDVPCGYSGNWKLTIRVRAASPGRLTSRERALRIADLVSLGLIL